MILMAAGAVGLASTRFAILFMWRDLASIQVPALDTWAGWRRFLFGPNQLALNATRFGNVILLNLLMWLILAVIILRLRRPRPPLGELLRQPGFVACVSPVLTFVGCLVLSLSPLPRAVYAAVLVSAAPLSWMVLIATRQWRPEPGWIDCLGRVAGVTLMASFLAHLVLVSLPI